MLSLRKVDYELLVPEYILHDEITKNPAAKLLSVSLRRNEIESLPSCDSNLMKIFQDRHPSIGRGEAEVILGAKQRLDKSETVACVIDDGPARHIASELCLPIIGTIGLINRLGELKIVDAKKVTAMKQKLERSSFRIDRKLLYLSL